VGAPVRVVFVGDEDRANPDLIPVSVAAGGHEARVYYLRYDQGQALDLVKHAAHLEEIVVTGDFRVVYLDQVLDHLDSNLNSHTQHDVRSALSPLRGIARRRGIMAAYTAHPNKLGGHASLRDRVGGSGQFTDIARSALYVGFHPEREGWRAVARGKGNAGVVPPALMFRIEGTFVTNPETREPIEVGMVAEIEPDPYLKAEEILPHEPRPAEDTETGDEKIERVAERVGAGGGWHSRKELADACAAEGIPDGTFNRYFPALTTIVRENSGREAIWRVKQ
jgi:hypothetical protein